MEHGNNGHKTAVLDTAPKSPANVASAAGRGTLIIIGGHEEKTGDREILHRVAEADCTLLLIHDAEADDAIRYYASLILSFQRSAWVFSRDGDLKGLQVDAAVVKNRLAPPGHKQRWIVPYPIP